MTYRRAHPDDAPATLAVVRAGFETYRAFAPPGWEPPDWLREDEVERSRAELAAPATIAFVAEDATRVVGHIRIIDRVDASRDGTTPDVHLRLFFVLEACWGSGVARTLHDMAVAEVRGTARLYTPAAQARARRFYEREGWSLHDGPFLEPAMGLPLVEYRLTGRSI